MGGLEAKFQIEVYVLPEPKKIKCAQYDPSSIGFFEYT